MVRTATVGFESRMMGASPLKIRVRVTGDLQVSGALQPDSLETGKVTVNGARGQVAVDVVGDVKFSDGTISGVHRLQINDPGPDGRIAWKDTDATMYVAPLNDGNSDGQLRIKNTKGISLEDNVRVTGDLDVAGAFSPAAIDTAKVTVNAGAGQVALDVIGDVKLSNGSVTGVHKLGINDPGPDGRIFWKDTNAVMYVAPLNDANSDGALRIQNDKGISLEDDVSVTGDLSVSGAFKPDELEVKKVTVNGVRHETSIRATGDIVLSDNDVLGVQHFQINDPGPDGRISWKGTNVKMFVSPLDGANTDGMLRLQNDKGISLEDNVRTDGDLDVGGNLSIAGDVEMNGTFKSDFIEAKKFTAKGVRAQTAIDVTGNITLADNDILGVQHFKINDPGPDGRISWGGTGAKMFVSPLDGANTDGMLRVQNNKGISLEDNVRTDGNLDVGGNLKIAGDVEMTGTFKADHVEAKKFTAKGTRGQTTIGVTGNIALADNDILGVQHFQINDPGPDGRISWAGTNVQMFVSPLDGANTDGMLRIKNDKGISLEDNVRTSNDLTVATKLTSPEINANKVNVAGQRSQTAISESLGNIALTDNDILGVQHFQINDPGPDGRISWAGTKVQMFVSPLDGANTDGMLRIQNDGGISLEDNVRTTGDFDVQGALVADELEAKLIKANGQRGQTAVSVWVILSSPITIFWAYSTFRLMIRDRMVRLLGQALQAVFSWHR